jgi:hypothetical protein
MEESMKTRVMITILLVAVMATYSYVPQASADPLTALAIVGVAAVLSASTIDIVAGQYDDNRDYRAQHDKAEEMRAQEEATKETPSPTKIELAAIKTD